jgi:hypothetical protein
MMVSFHCKTLKNGVTFSVRPSIDEESIASRESGG